MNERSKLVVMLVDEWKQNRRRINNERERESGESSCNSFVPFTPTHSMERTKLMT